MKYVIFAMTVGCIIHTSPLYGMEARQEPQRSGGTQRRQETAGEMMERFKRQTPPAEMQELQRRARRILEEEEARRQARIAQATGTPSAATTSGSGASRPQEVKSH